MREFKVSVKVKAIKGGPQRYTYNLDAFREARKTNFLRPMRAIVQAPNTNTDSLAEAILQSGLSLEEICSENNLLFHAMDRNRIDLFRLLLSIPGGWDFAESNKQLGVSLTHFAVTRANAAFLYYILLASDDPQQLLALRSSNGLTLVQRMQVYQHPLLPYLDSLVNVNYPRAWPATYKENFKPFSCAGIVEEYPQLNGFISPNSSCIRDAHLLSTAAAATSYLLPKGEPLEFKVFSLEPFKEMGDIFKLALSEGVEIIHFAEHRVIYNPLTPSIRDETLNGFMQSIQNIRDMGLPLSSAAQKDYDACMNDRNRTACVTLAYNTPSFLEGYNPRRITDIIQPFCDYLNEGLLIVTASNRGVRVANETNVLTMGDSCSAKQSSHLIIVTRVEYSPDDAVLFMLSDHHNHGPTVYAVATTTFQPASCLENPLCVTFDNSYGTSYAAPQVLGIVMQIQSVLRLNNVTYTADTVVDILNKGCVAATKPHLAKCLVDPPRVFEAAVKYAEKHKTPHPRKTISPAKKVPPSEKQNTPQKVSGRSFMSSVGAGVYSGISHGAIRSVGNLIRQRGQQQGHGWIAVEAQAQIVMFSLLFTLKKMVEQQDAVSAATEALLFLTVQGLFYGCARVCRDLSQSAAEKDYIKTSKGIALFASVVEMAPMANTLSDPVEGLTGLGVGAVTERLCHYGLLANKKQKRVKGPVVRINRDKRSKKAR